ncbi:MAG: ATP-dependent DNA ligase [Candidatus Pacearchaeota archaeon]
MRYSELVEVYESLGATTKRLEKTEILAKFLKQLKNYNSKWIYLLRGRVLPDYDPTEFGLSRQLAIKAISRATGISEEKIEREFNKFGDLGEVAEHFINTKKQSTLFSNKLTVEKVFDNFSKILYIKGKGSVDKKLLLVSELLASATGKEAKYIIRTILNDLRIGVADSTLRDAISEAFFPDDKKEMNEKIEHVYDLANDFAEVFDAVSKGKKALDKIIVVPGKPMNVMLPVKVTEISEAFRIAGKPAAIEHKYDGFRVVISKNRNEIKLFTRKLEEVTKQFPDVVSVVKEQVHAKDFILDSEVVGYDPKTKKPRPFEAISQRIKRKYDIERLEKELPVEVNVFDVIYCNGESLITEPFKKRRDILEKIVKEKQNKIRHSKQFVTDSEKKALEFYRKALASGEEGIMIKNLDAPYKPGRRVGFIVKMKPESKDLDLVIVGAEHGTGKRGGWLTSYIVACRNKEGKFLEVGKVSSGLKEKEEQGTTYAEMTKLIKPLITGEKGHMVNVKPKIIVSVTYQNIQKSPSYSSGYALRFPRITAYRPERNTRDIATFDEIKRL